MVLKRKFKAFDETIFDRHPDLKKALKPNDYYPELENILNYKAANIPAGSHNTKVIISDGQIVERVFKTPKGQVVSLFSKTSNVVFDQAA